MPSLRPLLALLLFVAAYWPLAAQDAPPHGTEFWLGFLERYVDPSDPDNPLVQLRLEIVAGDRAAVVRVEVPAGGWSADLTLRPGEAGAVIVPEPLAAVSGSESVDNRSVHVVASAPVVVNAISHDMGSADATTVLPMEALGRDYVIATYDPIGISATLQGYAEFVVVATDDATTVEITPTVSTRGGRPAGIPFSVLLNRGERYQVQSDENLSGSRVRSVGGNPCDRFAVFAGNLLTKVECGSADHLYEQMLPITALGRDHLFVPSGGRTGGDIVEVIAIEDDTRLTDWQGGAPPVLDAGERLRMLIDSAAYISASRPVAVVQYARGRVCDSATLGDPFELQLRPLDEQGIESVVDFIAPGALTFARHYLTIVTGEAGATSLLLDGAPLIAGGSFSDAPGFGWLTIEVAPGAHRLTGSSIVGAVLSGVGPAISYGVDLTGSRRSGVPVIRQTCSCEGVVLEASGGFETYRWSNGDTTRRIVARESGDYVVTAGSNGCATQSAPVSVSVRDASATARLEPRDATIAPGDIVPYTLVLNGRSAPTTCALGVELVALRFRATMLAPDAIDGGRIVGDTLIGNERILTIRATSDTILLDMVAAFGDTTAAAVLLHGIGLDSCMRRIGDTLSRLTFTDCEVGGRRLYIDREAAVIKPLRPDPIRGRATVEFRTLEEGPTRLEIVDLLGRTAATLLETDLRPGDHTAALDASRLAPGVYLLVLRTGRGEVVRRVRVGE